jgi:hypothetical protein
MTGETTFPLGKEHNKNAVHFSLTTVVSVSAVAGMMLVLAPQIMLFVLPALVVMVVPLVIAVLLVLVMMGSGASFCMLTLTTAPITPKTSTTTTAIQLPFLLYNQPGALLPSAEVIRTAS